MRRLSLSALAVVMLLLYAPFSFGADAQQRDAAAGAKSSPTVDLNSAGGSELESLPGIGPRMAERIIAYRREHGGFKKIEELMNVRGIGEKNFLKLRPLISVSPPKTKRAGASS